MLLPPRWEKEYLEAEAQMALTSTSDYLPRRSPPQRDQDTVEIAGGALLQKLPNTTLELEPLVQELDLRSFHYAELTAPEHPDSPC